MYNLLGDKTLDGSNKCICDIEGKFELSNTENYC